MKIGIIAIISLVAAVALCGVLPAVTAHDGGGGSDKGEGSTQNPKNASNCLSLPVIWSDGVNLTLRGDLFPATEFNDTWWHHWGYNNNTGEPLSCLPDPDNGSLCDDGTHPGYGSKPVYLQQQINNTWQAEWLNATDENLEVHVDLIEWGDNLEAVSWNEYSVVRTEVVLFQNLSKKTDFLPMWGFEMDHVYGHGIGEMWGTKKNTYQSDQATVYSGCARMTIQKVNDSGYNISNAGEIDGNLSLTWNPNTGEWEGDVSGTCFNGEVWVVGDGPGYYAAEINVGGKVIYGYNWKLRDTGFGPGFYRLTFSLDPVNCPHTLNTFFTNGTTTIVEFGVEEETETDPNGGEGNESEPNEGGAGNNPGNLIPGGRAKIDFTNNLTYMDVQILKKNK